MCLCSVDILCWYASFNYSEKFTSLTTHPIDSAHQQSGYYNIDIPWVIFRPFCLITVFWRIRCCSVTLDYLQLATQFKAFDNITHVEPSPPHTQKKPPPFKPIWQDRKIRAITKSVYQRCLYHWQECWNKCTTLKEIKPTGWYKLLIHLTIILFWNFLNRQFFKGNGTFLFELCI